MNRKECNNLWIAEGHYIETPLNVQHFKAYLLGGEHEHEHKGSFKCP